MDGLVSDWGLALTTVSGRTWGVPGSGVGVGDGWETAWAKAPAVVQKSADATAIDLYKFI
jgi:hypothetical protein